LYGALDSLRSRRYARGCRRRGAAHMDRYRRKLTSSRRLDHPLEPGDTTCHRVWAAEPSASPPLPRAGGALVNVGHGSEMGVRAEGPAV
jgi:hypothetical protein